MSLMLVNPRSRRRRHNPKRRRHVARRRRHNPIMAAPNPRRRRRHARRHNPIGIARVHHRRHTRRRRNPIGGMGNLGTMVMNGLKGAAGGVAVNAVTNFLPAAVRTGNVLYVTRTALALLVGTFGRQFMGVHARAVAEGALAINFADLINSFAGGSLPGSQLHGAGGEYMGEFLSGRAMRESLPYSYAPGMPGTAHLDTQLAGMGEYMSDYSRV